MDPIEFPMQTAIAAEHQDEYRNLPMCRTNDRVISCWKLTDEELKKIQETGVIWMSLVHSPSQLITPSLLEVDSPFGEEGNEHPPFPIV